MSADDAIDRSVLPGCCGAGIPTISPWADMTPELPLLAGE